MIKSLTIRNFKGIGDEQTYDFTNFDLLVGRNNSGKSTILQALAIWQFCIDEFRRNVKSAISKTGIQIVLPNFTPLPVPEFRLLWHKQTERKNVRNKDDKFKPEYILIEFEVLWLTDSGEERNFTILIRYSSKQSIYAIPKSWAEFTAFDKENLLPSILYVPPYSGLEDDEERRDLAVIRKYVGKFQAGSVLRNILLRVYSQSGDSTVRTKDDEQNWQELKILVQKLFSVELLDPVYRPEIDTLIKCEYQQSKDRKKYDLISGGTGFHQSLILFSFLFGFNPNVVLFDEPDAHMHSNLQREVLGTFQKLSIDRDVQFIVATHSEEFITGVNATQIISLLKGVPERIEAKPDIITALSEISNIEITQTKVSPFILYVEGEDDERILRSWAGILDRNDVFDKYFIKPVGGGSKKGMESAIDKHFAGLKTIVPNVTRKILFDYDTEDSYHPKHNDVLFEWSRKNIENYLLVPTAWRKAVLSKLNEKEETMFNTQPFSIIDQFFNKQRLTLGRDESWKDIDIEIFKILDGKKLLFENANSLFQQLRSLDKRLILNRQEIASSMKKEELHQDILDFFSHLEKTSVRS